MVPDGTIRDGNSLPRGYWEAKDTDDDLDEEIKKKKAKGYPLTNIIFEDTRVAVLYQSEGRGFARRSCRRRATRPLCSCSFSRISSPTLRDSSRRLTNSRIVYPNLLRACCTRSRKRTNPTRNSSRHSRRSCTLPECHRPEDFRGNRRRDAGSASAHGTPVPHDL